MKARDVVLLALDAYGGVIAGRTLLQKICYFADVTLGLGLNYRPHYYGPYSSVVDEAVGQVKSLGFVSEQAIGFGISGSFGELRRFDYLLTNDGREIVEELKRREPDRSEEVQQVVDAIRAQGNPDYLALSIAAKTYFILKRHGKPMTSEEVRREAKGFDWAMQPHDVDSALGLLNGLDLLAKK